MTAPPQRRQPLQSRFRRANDQNPTSSQPSTSACNLPATISVAAGSSLANPAPVEGADSTGVLLWNRPASSALGQYKAEMLSKLNMNTLACRSDATRMMKGNDPTVSGLYRISGVDWLLAEQEQFSSATTLRFVDPRWIASIQYHGTREP